MTSLMPSTQEIENFFLKPSENYPITRPYETIIIGEQAYTPSVVRRAAELLVAGKLSYNVTLVGGRPVYDGSPRAHYIRSIQEQNGVLAGKPFAPVTRQSGFEPSTRRWVVGETESRYMARALHSDLAALRTDPNQYYLYWPEVDRTDNLKSIVHQAFRMIDLPEYRTKEFEADYIPVAVVCLPWHMKRVMAVMCERREELGRKYCFIPHMAWPYEANVVPYEEIRGRAERDPRYVEANNGKAKWDVLPVAYWAHQHNVIAQAPFRQEYAKIAGDRAPHVEKGFYKPVDPAIEARRVDAYNNEHRGANLRPRAFE